MAAVLEKPRTKKYSVEQLLGVADSDNLKLAKRIEKGLSFDALERVSKITQLSIDQLRVAVRIAPRTLARRRQERRLSPQESDRLVSLSRLFAMTFELFEGDAESGLQWFVSPNRALNGMSPLEAAATEIGSREVENLIGRLEHGVYS